MCLRLKEKNFSCLTVYITSLKWIHLDIVQYENPRCASDQNSRQRVLFGKLHHIKKNKITIHNPGKHNPGTVVKTLITFKVWGTSGCHKSQTLQRGKCQNYIGESCGDHSWLVGHAFNVDRYTCNLPYWANLMVELSKQMYLITMQTCFVNRETLGRITRFSNTAT